MSLSSRKSLTPVMVMVWVTFQLAAVKTTLLAEIVPSAVLLECRLIVTFAVGWELRMIWKVAVPPASLVISPPMGTTVMPGASSSALVTDTSAASMLLYWMSALLEGAVMIV